MLSPKAAAQSLGVSASLIYEWCRSGRLKHYRFGCRGRGKLLISEDDLKEFIETCRITGVDERPLKFIR